MAIHGSNCYVNLDSTVSGSPTDVSSYAREVNLTLDNAMHDTTTFGSSSHTKTTGLKDGKFTVTFILTNTIMDILTAIFVAQTPGGTGTVSFVIGPRGSTTGQEKISGECLLSALPIPETVDNIVIVAAAFEVTGTTTIGVF